MDYLFGIRGKDFVMVVSDTAAVQQIINIKHDEDKLVPIDSHKIMGLAGAVPAESRFGFINTS
jgi:20S proteasome subunit beta 4